MYFRPEGTGRLASPSTQGLHQVEANAERQIAFSKALTYVKDALYDDITVEDVQKKMQKKINHNIHHQHRHSTIENVYLELGNKVYDIYTLVNKVPRSILNALLVAHTFSGSNATSAIFGMGSFKALKPGRIEDSIVQTSHDKNSTKADIIKSGIKLMSRLYDDSYEDLNHLRIFSNRKKLAPLKNAALSHLPPTEDSVAQHSS